MILISFTLLFNYQSKVLAVNNDHLIILLCFVIIFFIGYQLFFNEELGYSKVFNKNDALHSWNRWGIELSNNKYIPTGAGYPVLFSSLWSLLYRYQDGLDFQIIVKLSMLLQPLIIFLITGFLWQIKEKIFSILFFLISAILISSYKGELLSGHMDAPVAILILVSNIFLILYVKFLDNKNTNFSNAMIETAGIFSGLAAMTKQAGMLSIIVYLIFILYFYFKTNISLKKLFYYFLISCVPYLLFLTLFNSVDGNLLGNLDYLSNLVKQQIKDRNIYIHSLAFLKAGVGETFVIILFFSSIYNFFKIRENIHLLGALFLLSSIIGFFIFANCCAYAPRNGWWILSFLSASFFCSITPLFKKTTYEIYNNKLINKNILYLFYLFIVIVISLLMAFNIKKSELIDLQNESRWGLIDTNISTFFKQKNIVFDNNDILISDIDYIRFVPLISKHFKYCGTNDENCFNEKSKNYENIYILIKNASFKNSFLKKYINNEHIIFKIKASKHNELDYLLIGPFKPNKHL